MAKFVKSNYSETINGLMSDANDRMVMNAHYMFNNLKPVQCTFYNIDKDASTYDQAVWNEASVIGPISPFKYNKIKNATLYGSDLRAIISMDYNENGLEAAPIEFELVVIPNTFVPYHNSFIIFDQLTKIEKTKDYLFIVDEVSPDTFENGSNCYKIRCHLYATTATERNHLENQVVRTYVMTIDNAGTDMKCVLTEEDYDIVSNFDTVIENLKKYYQSMFWNDSVQTFTYCMPNGLFYDPYLIEFIIRNRLFDTSNKGYIYVHHELPMPATFAIDYMDSVYRAIENRDLGRFTDRFAYGVLIDNINTLFATVPEKYFAVVYDKPAMFGLFQPLPGIMTKAAQDNELFVLQEPASMYNIITTWFNTGKIPPNTLDILDNIKFERTKEFFYYIPICIFVIEQYIENIVRKTS